MPGFRRADDALGFLDDEELIRPRRSRNVSFTPDGQAISTLSAAVARSETEVQPQIVLRIVARAAHHFVDLACGRCGDLHARADRRSVRARARRT